MNQPTPRPRLTPLTALLAVYFLVFYPTWLLAPFFAAGTWRWGGGCSYWGVMLAGLLLQRRYVRAKNPELAQHRREIGQGTKGWDLAWNLAFWPLLALVPLAAGFDVRFAFSPMTAWLWPLGLGVAAAGFFFSSWAMSVNPHFEGTVRIQTERGHRVVDTGPYRHIRHPGYLGLALMGLGGPFVLGSWVALGPAVVVVGWIVLRTVLEDRTLRRELEGYAAYAQRVRFRLVPGVF